jgi:hypothetical protein
MSRLMLGLLVAVSLWGSAPAPSSAQPLCGDRGAILESLEKNHAETPQAIGLSQDGALLEVVVSPTGGWTILITYPKRPTCVVATGEDWNSLAVAAGHPV